jgi:hypothetical protein
MKFRRINMKWLILVIALLMTGCSSIARGKYMIASTQSGIGFLVGIKETNQTPEIRLGYMRNELVFVPVIEDRVAPVLARLNFKSIWVKEGGISSVIATGDAATNESVKALIMENK